MMASGPAGSGGALSAGSALREARSPPRRDRRDDFCDGSAALGVVAKCRPPDQLLTSPGRAQTDVVGPATRSAASDTPAISATRFIARSPSAPKTRLHPAQIYLSPTESPDQNGHNSQRFSQMCCARHSLRATTNQVRNRLVLAHDTVNPQAIRTR